MRSEQSASIKFLYPVIVRITSFAGIFLLISAFLIFPRPVNTFDLEEEFQIIIEQIDIPQTEQFDRPPPPARPSVPVESESEDIADDVSLEDEDDVTELWGTCDYRCVVCDEDQCFCEDGYKRKIEHQFHCKACQSLYESGVFIA